MKKLFVSMVCLACIGFGFSTPEKTSEKPLKSSEKLFSPMGTVSFISCNSINYRLQLNHSTGTLPTVQADLFIDGVDTGRNVTVGSSFVVPKSATSFVLYLPSFEFSIIYASGFTSQFENQTCTP